MMCVLVEDMRGVDFYAKPPASMNGFMVEMKVLTSTSQLSATLLLAGGDGGACACGGARS